MPKIKLVTSQCQICGGPSYHREGYEPITCGKYTCLQKAAKRGLFKKLGKEVATVGSGNEVTQVNGG
jgi:hypothetical protein